MDIVLVALGGGLGALLRYGLSSALSVFSPPHGFPLATFLVNVLGCLCAGLLLGWLEKQGGSVSATRWFLMVGLLGGFTTFSAFSAETFSLLRQAEIVTALLYVLVSMVGGISFFAAGFMLVTLW